MLPAFQPQESTMVRALISAGNYYYIMLDSTPTQW